MTVKSEPYYWIVCDGVKCGVNAQEGSDYSAWKEPDSAWTEADASGWSEEDGKHYCEKCTIERASDEETS